MFISYLLSDWLVVVAGLDSSYWLGGIAAASYLKPSLIQ